MDGYTKQKYHEAIDRAVTKTTNDLIENGKIDKNTTVGVNVEISFLIGNLINRLTIILSRIVRIWLDIAYFDCFNFHHLAPCLFDYIHMAD